MTGKNFMIRNLNLISLFLMHLTVPSCNLFDGGWACDASGPIIVYKTKQDYSNNLSIQVSKDKKSVTCYPGKGDAVMQKPVQLENGYLLKRMCGDVFLSLTIDEYVNSSKYYTPQELLSLVIDFDPYLEKFECCECTGSDTAKINSLIRTSQLSNCKDIK